VSGTPRSPPSRLLADAEAVGRCTDGTGAISLFDVRVALVTMGGDGSGEGEAVPEAGGCIPAHTDAIRWLEYPHASSNNNDSTSNVEREQHNSKKACSRTWSSRE